MLSSSTQAETPSSSNQWSTGSNYEASHVSETQFSRIHSPLEWSSIYLIESDNDSHVSETQLSNTDSISDTFGHTTLSEHFSLTRCNLIARDRTKASHKGIRHHMDS